LNVGWGTVELGLIAGIGLGSVYALLALSYNMILASSGVFNLTQGATITVGIVGSYVLSHRLGLHGPSGLLVLAAAGGALGFVTERLAVRPFLGGSAQLGREVIVSTLGLGLTVTAIVALLFGQDSFLIQPYLPQGPLVVAGLNIQPIYIAMLIAAVAVALAMELFLYFTSAGIIMRATISDREGAGLIGVGVGRVIQLTFVLGGALGAVAGFLIAPVVSVSVFSGDTVALYGFAALTIGGFGSFRGSLLGGMIVGLLVGMTPVVFEPYWTRPIVYLALLVVLLVKPAGLFGLAETFGGGARDV
jgi:branched-chain amino acid transport system permease protein